MTSAATSRSRTAWIARPGRVRTMFLASSATSATSAQITQNHAWFGVQIVPKISRVLDVEEPDVRRRVDRRARVAAGDLLEVAEQVLAEEHEAERHDRQVVAAQAQRERPDERADRRAPNSAAREQPQRQRQVELAADLRGDVRAAAEEERVAERDLAGVAGQQVQADRADRGDARVVEDRQPEVVVDDLREQRATAATSSTSPTFAERVRKSRSSSS